MREKNEKLLNTYKIEFLCVHSEQLSWGNCSSFHYPTCVQHGTPFPHSPQDYLRAPWAIS